MSESALLFVRAITLLHPGAPEADGVIDMPVDREPHTGWPRYTGKGVKGGLRDMARNRYIQNHEKAHGEKLLASEADKSDVIETVFGPSKEGSKHSGAISSPYLSVLLFPVESEKGIFGWITCPEALVVLRQNIQMSGVKNLESLMTVFDVSRPNALTCQDSDLSIGSGDQGTHVVLGQVKCIEVACAALLNFSNRLGELIKPPRNLSKLIAVVDNNTFTQLVIEWTQKNTGNALDPETKNVKPSALFNVEDLPQETVLQGVITFNASRRESPPEDLRTASDILNYFEHPDWLGLKLGAFAQFGGGETTSKGNCRLNLVSVGDSK